MIGEQKLGQDDSSPWEAAVNGLRLIAEYGEFGEPGSIRHDLLADAEGFLALLRGIDLHGARLPDTVNGNLINYGIRSNNTPLIEASLGAVNAFTRFDLLGDVLIELSRPDARLDVGEALWRQWFDQANDAAGAEIAVGDAVGSDYQFTLATRMITEFRLQISQSATAEEEVAVAQSAKEAIEATFDSIDTEERGTIEFIAGREYLIKYLTGRFDQVCGEAGLWRLMFNQKDSVPYRIYKSAAGELDGDDMAALQAMIDSKVPSHVLTASAILAAGNFKDEDINFKLLMRQSLSPLFSRYDSTAINAFRWANPELWAFSVGRPRLGIMDVATLENIIDVDRPELMPEIWERYSDVCQLAADKNSAMIVLGFAMALQMTRSAHIEPGEEAYKMLGAYLSDGSRLQSALSELDPGNKLKYELVMERLKKWMGTTWPRIDSTAELRTELDVLEETAAIVGINAATLETLREYVQSHWNELRARRSQDAMVAEMGERVDILLDLSQQAVEAARTLEAATPKIPGSNLPKVTFADSPVPGETYL